MAEGDEVYALERPHPSLLTLYIVRAVLSGPLVVLTLPLLVFRYHTLRYRFDAQGIHMQWGVLFRRQINLTYARIQDIHVQSGVVQRWLGLADLMVQTAAGAASPEMKIEGFKQYEAIRDFLYARMRGSAHKGQKSGEATRSGERLDAEALELLHGIRDELRATREALERRGGAT